MKTIWIASDHAGFELKEELTRALANKSFSVKDLGCTNKESVDYPDYANRVAEALKNISTNEGFGLLICGSGQGMSMRANKYPWIRAALCWRADVVGLAREHNDANLLVLGSRWTAASEALEFIRIFSETEFAQGRHSTRVAKVGLPL